SDTSYFNFGQDSSFAGTETAQGNQDGNDKGDFYYEPPSGYLALCTDNLSTPEIALPTAHFNTILYSGTGSSHAITGVGFQPDFTWIKKRSAAESHDLQDSVRGATKRLSSNSTAAETTVAGSISSFDTDGFTVVDAGTTNENTYTYAAWNWKAGTSVSGTTGGAGTGTAYSGSASATAGFSIIKYIGNSTAGHGIPHHLGVVPEMFIVKNRDDAGTGWMVYHKDLTSYLYFIALDGTGAEATVSNDRWYSVPDATYNYLQEDLDVNEVNEADNYIMYSFASIEGYSKVGSYTGNSNADGPMFYCGFKPSWAMFKATGSAQSWTVFDNKRNVYNLMDNSLFPDLSDVENDATSLSIDFVSNGIKIRSTHNYVNYSGSDYLVLAFAESPFKTSNAR
ncbi:MAG: hypothetical protein QF535_07335, partial [Anaerolineales bacterium]|nr:hypothetical protein [Anaerolineales bacterium]